MPINEHKMNNDYIHYFSLEEYVDNIKLLPFVLERLEEINNDFNAYIKKLSQYDENYIMNYWIYLSYKELKDNQNVENIDFDKIDLQKGKIFFDTLSISHKRIHELHNFVTSGQYDPVFEYRNTEVNVSRFNRFGNEEIFWRGAQPEDVKPFMNDFIELYKKNDVSTLMSSPFLKSALIHLLFLRIHPYKDGNGRTARMLHNLKFTESINKHYGTKLKISPLNLSESIDINKITYVNRIDSIYFDLDHFASNGYDNNEAINAWFYFILDMVEEQIYASGRRLDKISESCLKQYQKDTDDTITKKMELSKMIGSSHVHH